MVRTDIVLSTVVVRLHCRQAGANVPPLLQVVSPPHKLREQVTRATPASLSELTNLLASINLAPLQMLESEPSIISAAGIFHCGTPQVRGTAGRSEAACCERLPICLPTANLPADWLAGGNVMEWPMQASGSCGW